MANVQAKRSWKCPWCLKEYWIPAHKDDPTACPECRKNQPALGPRPPSISQPSPAVQTPPIRQTIPEKSEQVRSPSPDLPTRSDVFCFLFLCGFFSIVGYIAFFADDEKKEPEVARPSEAMVRIIVYDDTKTKPVHEKAAVFLKGVGYWPLKEEMKYGSTSRSMGLKAINILYSGEDAILLYPDGEMTGKKIAIPFKMTDDMTETGTDEDVIHIEISDDQIKVVGLAIKAATGKAAMRFSR